MTFKGDISQTASLAGEVAQTGSLAGDLAIGEFTSTGSGANGITFIPSIDEDGTLSWTNDGWMENPEPVNLMGPQGPQGEKGERGDPGTVPDEVVAAAVASYLAKNKSVRIAEITLHSDKWEGTSSPYSQVVTIDGVTPFSQVDLTPDVEQLTIFHDKDIAFVTENEDGVVTVYAIGVKPSNDYTMQVTIKEVAV